MIIFKVNMGNMDTNNHYLSLMERGEPVITSEGVSLNLFSSQVADDTVTMAMIRPMETIGKEAYLELSSGPAGNGGELGNIEFSSSHLCVFIEA